MAASRPPSATAAACAPTQADLARTRADDAHCGRGGAAAGAVWDAASWGLPTPMCPIDDDRLRALRQRHSSNRRAGRVLLYCFRGAALGNYLQPLPTAMLLAFLLDLAIVLRCDPTKHATRECPLTHAAPPCAHTSHLTRDNGSDNGGGDHGAAPS